MTDKELRRLSRADLLEMLIDQSKELQELRKETEELRAELQKREIAISQAGSIAEASLMLNGVFEAAQAACQEYVENTCKLYGHQEIPQFSHPIPKEVFRSVAPGPAVPPVPQKDTAEKPNQYAVKVANLSSAPKRTRAQRYQTIAEGYDPE